MAPMKKTQTDCRTVTVLEPQTVSHKEVVATRKRLHAEQGNQQNNFDSVTENNFPSSYDKVG